LTEGGKITGFNNELLVHVRYNMSASPNALKFAAGKDGEIQHVRDALRAASMANGYRNRTFYSARDIAANTARGLIGTNISGEAAKATMEGSLGDWARQSMQDSHVQWDGLYKPHWYVE
jgi:hypothetical protein